MKISTSVQFDRASTTMSKLQNELATSQAQISSQKQVLNPSDAPSQTATILRINSLIDRQTSYGKTIDSLQGRLDNENTTLSSASDVIIRVKELAIQASNGTQGVATRQIIATEMTGLRDQLLSLANRKLHLRRQPGAHTALFCKLCWRRDLFWRPNPYEGRDR
jgi:flagellar hook-associated protein 3 FlgL